ncbi:MAG: cyclase family protein [Chroococcidiopsidaceae cyanobacterium CP_BM_RX_35]|nr:cyclase family protein [Chroococcidiopsidaceae cyanobacterium CP_BM_RX_35]
MKKFQLLVLGIFLSALTCVSIAIAQPPPESGLWQVYQRTLKSAKYVDLTHTITPSMPVWSGFGSPKFSATINPKTGNAYTYQADGFEATNYVLPTDQLGTQLDPPAHWNPNSPSIDELPPTFAVRPLVVIPIQDKVAQDPNYSLKVEDILTWEKQYGRIPEGSVVFVRSDWFKEWSKPDFATRTKFPGVSLAALKFLHLQRRILFHGHEPLDTDSTPTLEGEAWLLKNGYTQAEGVANLDRVPQTGALVAIGYPKFQGGLGGYARYIAICLPNWQYGASVGQIPESPLQKATKPLHWDKQLGVRVRS